MKKKISKIMFMFVFPIVACLTLGIFFDSGFVSGHVSALVNKGGGLYIGNLSTAMIIKEDSAISGYQAVDGGGVYVESGGTLTMDGGVISGNTATSGNGHNVYNAGIFTMNGGTVGTSESTQTGYGIYNTGTMTLSGGTVYDNIYSSASFTTTPNATLNGTITLGDDATITVENYNGTTPNYTINLPSSRASATVLTFKGSTTQPNLDNINILGDLSSLSLKAEQSATDETMWSVKVVCILTLKSGTGVSSVSGAGTYDYGESVAINFTLNSNYENGFWSHEDGSVCQTDATGSVTIRSDTTLTASATPKVYKITLNNQSATTSGTATIYEKYGVGYYSDSGATSSISSITIPTKTGYNFNGYYTSTGGSGTQIINSSGSIVASNTKFTFDSTKTIYASWKANTYTVSFNQNGGTGGQTSSITMTYGQKYSSSVTIPTNSNVMYSFLGYYYNNSQYFDSSGKCVKACDFTSDVTMTASWEKLIFVRVNEDGEKDESGEYALMGEYPQTKVTKNLTISTLELQYKNLLDDVQSYNNNLYYRTSANNWYKIEPIKWKIVREYSDYGWMTLISENILDASIFNDRTDGYDSFYINNKTNSVLADKVYGLNYGGNYFLPSGVVTKGDDSRWNVSLADYYNGSGYGGNSSAYSYPTRVPSCEEYYGLTSIYNSNSVATTSYNFTKSKTATDYAKAKGCSDNSWWTMTGESSNSSHNAFYVNSNGELISGAIETIRGVVPLVNVSVKDFNGQVFYFNSFKNLEDSFVDDNILNSKENKTTFTSNQKVNKSEEEKELTTRTFSTLSDIDSEILLDDKKKFDTFLFVDKRYMSNGYEAKNFQI